VAKADEVSPVAEAFRDTASYRATFTAGLQRMLGHDELGVFILVFANASFDAEIYRALRPQLLERFEAHAEALRKALRDGHVLHHAPDDLLVFLKLMVVGFDGLEATRFRRDGPWELQFNQLRSFRPPRMSNAVVTSLRRPFDAGAFHFNKVFLRKEILWDGELRDVPCRLLYNKFPFADLHGLLVVAPDEERPQFLAEPDHHYLCQLVAELGHGLPGVGFGYNAYGAYASVNHQHFQMFVREAERGPGLTFPIEDGRWRHNGGAEPYPLKARRFETAAESWECIDALHRRNVGYNLLYRPGCTYVTTRAFQGSYQHAGWTSGFAWSEVAGAFTTFNADDFATLDDARIREEFARLSG
jgi:hypothetical protein